MAVILIEKGKQKGQRFEVLDSASPTIIGRDPAQHVPVDDERISRQHARLQRVRGVWVLEDLGSRNGILAGGQPVRRLEVRDGASFQIGSTTFLFREDERVDPLAGLEVQGCQLSRLLRDEAGVLVYQGRQLAMDRAVRVDVLHPRWSAAGEGEGDRLAAALRGSMAAAAAVSHPNVVPLLAGKAPDERGGISAVSRWTEHPPLSAALAVYVALPVGVRLLGFRRLAEAFQARGADVLGHPLGLRHVHLDPQRGPSVLALELPAAVALARGDAAHLPAFPSYLPPEQAEDGAAPSAAALVYNLGALGYHLLTGSPPMGAGSVEEVLERHRSLPPAPADLACPGLPAEVAKLLSSMLEKDPARRPSLEEVVDALPHVAEPEGAPFATERPSPQPAARKPAGPVSAQRLGARPALRPGAPARPAAQGAPGAAPAARPVRPRPPAPAAPPATGDAPRAVRAAPAPSRLADAAAPRRLPILVHLVFWPSLWAGLFLAGRFVMHAVLKK